MSGCRLLCLLIVWVRSHLASLLTHFHVPLACLELVLLCLKIQHKFKCSGPSKEHRGHTGTANSECFRFITVALLWRAGDWAGTANMTALSPWPRVKVMSLSKMNHRSSPEGPPGLLLKLYIIVFWKVREEEKKNCIWEQWSLTERSCILHESLFVCIFFLYQCEEKLWMILLDLFPKNYSRVMFT